MNVWIPGLIVVAVGLAAGLWYALRGKPDQVPEGDGGTRAAALETGSPAGPRTLFPSARRAGLVGFVAGVATCLVIGGLIYWATEGSKPRAERGDDAPERLQPAPLAQSPQGGTPDAFSPEEAARAHDESADLSPEVREQLQQLRAQVHAAPQDLNARRQLTVALLNANQLMEAFEQARELQRVAPGDPDGLFVEGVVRLAMGQWPLTVQLMDSILAQHPDHVLAFLAKGQAQAALGQTAAAIATWKQGLAAAGGSFPPLEELLAEAEAGGGAERQSAMSAPASAPPIAAESAGGGLYRIHVELAPGAVGPDGATLFVALRGDAAGPPAAVKRIPSPTFPLELALSADDSMVGQPLPDHGNLSIRLDGDGNASTLDPGDLTVAVKAFSGTPVSVVLER